MLLCVDSQGRVCWHRVLQNSGLAEHNAAFVEITCTDPRCFKQWSHAEFQNAVATVSAAARRVQAGAMAKVVFHEVETALGFRHNPLGLIADARLCDVVRPVETLTYDWVHSMLQGGVLTAEVEALMASANIDRQRLQGFLADTSWTFPRWCAIKSRALHRIFDERRAAADGAKVKASCSELLGVYGLLRFFFELELSGEPGMAASLKSYTALCTVIDLLLAAKRHQVDIDDVAGVTWSCLHGSIVRP